MRTRRPISSFPYQILPVPSTSQLQECTHHLLGLTCLPASSSSAHDKPATPQQDIIDSRDTNQRRTLNSTTWKGHERLNPFRRKPSRRNHRNGYQNARKNGKPNRLQQKKDDNSAGSFNQWLQHTITSTNSPNIQLAEDALWQRIQLEDTSSYNTVSFNIILNGWARQRSTYAAKKADQLLHKLLELQQQPSTSHLQADTYSYGAVLNAYAKGNGGKMAALRAEELLTQMQTTMFPSHTNATLKTDVCHNAVIDAWSVSGDPQAGERAESILRKLPSPSRISFNAAIKAYARSQAPMEAQRLLDEMVKLANESCPSLEPDKFTISTCIDAWSKWNKNLTYAAQQAESLLVQMEKDFEEWNRTNSVYPENSQSKKSNNQPDIITYTSVLTAYARAGSPEATEKAMQLIRRMEKYSDGKPNAPFFNTLIHSLAKSTGRTSTPSRPNTSTSSPVKIAEEILRYMKMESLNEDIRPCKRTYTAVIAVYASHYGRGLGAAKRCEELLDELEGLYNETELDLYLPNTKTFGAVLSVWAKAASMSASHEEGESFSAEFLWHRTESLLERMECLYHRTGRQELKPGAILYSMVFRILANGRDPHAATRALFLIQRMKAMSTDKTNNGYGDQLHIDSTMYAYLIVTFTKCRVENGIEVATQILQDVEEGYRAGMGVLKPTSLLYSAVLQAYAKSASKEGASLAEQLLERTKTLYKEGKLYAKPTTLFYNAVMDAHARSDGGREAAERAEELLGEMELRGRAGDSELCLTTRSFNAAILAWKNSNATDAPQRAEALLKRMSTIYKRGNEKCRPDRVTINSIIGVWAKSHQPDAAERAEKFLKFMENVHKTGDPINPDRYSFNTVMDAYSRSSEAGAARRAQALYERMKSLYEAGENDLRPDLITLTSLRQTWMASKDADAKNMTFKIGGLILEEANRRRKAATSANSFNEAE